MDIWTARFRMKRQFHSVSVTMLLTSEAADVHRSEGEECLGLVFLKFPAQCIRVKITSPCPYGFCVLVKDVVKEETRGLAARLLGCWATFRAV